jgi:hypothetical protein
MELATVAQALLTMPASEAAVERSFSAQDSIHTKKRNRLSASSVEHAMFLAFNNGQMNCSAEVVARPCTIELSVGFMETETEIDESSEDEEPIIVNEKKNDDDAMKGDEPAAATYVPAKRTQSVIDGDNRKFLEEFIELYQITEWQSINELQLESAALMSNPGGHSTKGLKQKCIAMLAAKQAAKLE